MYTKDDQLKKTSILNAPSNYYEGIQVKYKDMQQYFETITFLDSGEVVISTWIHTAKGIKEDVVQIFYPTERDWKLITAVHGEIKSGETRTTSKLWRGVTKCNFFECSA